MLTLTAAGKLGRDSELKTTQSGKQVLRFSVAVDVRRGNERATQWVDCAIWGDRGGKLADYLKKGTSVTVIGQAGVRIYEANGEPRVSLECSVSELTLQGGRQQDSAPTQRQAGTAVPIDLDDEIPF